MALNIKMNVNSLQWPVKFLVNGGWGLTTKEQVEIQI